jgi:hypothetical protein
VYPEYGATPLERGTLAIMTDQVKKEDIKAEEETKDTKTLDSLLLPLEEGKLETLAKTYAPPHHRWQYSVSRGLHSMVLRITKVGQPFRVSLDCGLRDHQLEVPFLRFHLVASDIKEILEDKKKLFNPTEVDKVDLRAYSSPQTSISLNGRRKHALIGQSILYNLSCFQHKEIFAMVSTQDLDTVKWATIFYALQRHGQALTTKLAFPEFDDLEDEDHDFDAEESAEMELVDEDAFND